MAPAQSRSGWAIIPSAKKSRADTIGPGLNRGKGKQSKKAARKGKTSRRVTTPSPTPQSDQELIKEIVVQPVKPTKIPIDVTECKYTIGCVTVFNDRKFNQDSGSFHLGEFNIYEYDTKAIKAVQAHAEKMKLGYELDSALAVISAPRLKQLTKMIHDPSDWQSFETLIEDYMKDGFRFLRVDYTITYSKAPRRVQDYDHGDDYNEDTPAQPNLNARRNVWSPY